MARTQYHTADGHRVELPDEYTVYCVDNDGHIYHGNIIPMNGPQGEQVEPVGTYHVLPEGPLAVVRQHYVPLARTYMTLVHAKAAGPLDRHKG